MRLKCEAILGIAALLFSGCYGDFGRPRGPLFGDNRAWSLGDQAAYALGQPSSAYPLSDQEVLMRDLAFNIIHPPYDRARWNQIVWDFALTGVAPPFEQAAARTFYPPWLITDWSTSSTSRYARLIDAIRNDVERLDEFIIPAAKVLELDRKRQQSFAYIPTLTVDEVANAQRRVAENTVIVDWVRWCLSERVGAYRFALERLVVATPANDAVQAERAIAQLDSRIAAAFTPGPATGILAVGR